MTSSSFRSRTPVLAAVAAAAAIAAAVLPWLPLAGSVVAAAVSVAAGLAAVAALAAMRQAAATEAWIGRTEEVCRQVAAGDFERRLIDVEGAGAPTAMLIAASI